MISQHLFLPLLFFAVVVTATPTPTMSPRSIMDMLKRQTSNSKRDSFNRDSAVKDTVPTRPILTESGEISGEQDESGFMEFHSVPFAKPPMGNYRWKDLVPPESWNGTKRTVDTHPPCPQLDLVRGEFFGREDCMYLSIYVPPACTKQRPCPVMHWIHGGAWIIGGNNQLDMYNGKKLAQAHNVVIVAANYRLDVLGWLALQELQDESTNGEYGNYGLRDQRYAMKWVRRNIGEFGGDISKMTIFGESAGGFSVCQHLVSPESNGLFHNAIVESGDCDGPWLILDGESSKKFGDLYAKDVGCPYHDERGERLACLRSRPLHKLMEPYLSWLCPIPRPNDPWCVNSSDSFGTRHYMSNVTVADPSKPWPYNRPPFAPIIGWAAVVDGTDAGLPMFPLDLMKQGKINKSPDGELVNVIMGTNEHEMALFLIGIWVVIPELEIHYPYSTSDLKVTMQHVSDYHKGWDGEQIWNQLQEVYPKDNFAHEAYRFVVASTDIIFRCGTRRALRALEANGNNVYSYNFNFHTLVYNSPDSLLCALSYEVGCGVHHAEEIKYVFNSDIIIEDFARQLALRMGSYWTNFAKFSDPNGDGLLNWPKYTASTDLYMEFADKDQVIFGNHKASCDFWDTLPE